MRSLEQQFAQQQKFKANCKICLAGLCHVGNPRKTSFDHVAVTPHMSKHAEAQPTTTEIPKVHNLHRTTFLLNV